MDGTKWFTCRVTSVVAVSAHATKVRRSGEDVSLSPDSGRSGETIRNCCQCNDDDADGDGGSVGDDGINNTILELSFFVFDL